MISLLLSLSLSIAGRLSLRGKGPLSRACTGFLLFTRSVICTARRPAIGPREGSLREGTTKETERERERQWSENEEKGRRAGTKAEKEDEEELAAAAGGREGVTVAFQRGL